MPPAALPELRPAVGLPLLPVQAPEPELRRSLVAGQLAGPQGLALPLLGREPGRASELWLPAGRRPGPVGPLPLRPVPGP